MAGRDRAAVSGVAVGVGVVGQHAVRRRRSGSLLVGGVGVVVGDRGVVDARSTLTVTVAGAVSRAVGDGVGEGVGAGEVGGGGVGERAGGGDARCRRGPVDRATVSGSPSGSVSLARTPVGGDGQGASSVGGVGVVVGTGASLTAR